MNATNSFRRPTREDLITLAKHAFDEGRFASIESLAEELGISRATAYNWVGNSDQLLERVILENTSSLFKVAEARCQARGKERICRILMDVSHAYVQQEALQTLFRKNPEKMLRLASTNRGGVQKTTVLLTERLLAKEIENGYLSIPLDAHTMAYVLVRICESFLYGELITGEAMDLEKQEIALGALLGK
jgi:AcrR family transcriptional regulator